MATAIRKTTIGGITVTLVGGARLLIGFTPYSADINEFCVAHSHCKPGLKCTAEYNAEIVELQDSAADADKLGSCIDVTGARDSAPGLQRDFDRIPYLMTTNESAGVEYRMPPGATILLGTEAGRPEATQTISGCVTVADNGATSDVDESKTVFCDSRPFIADDFDSDVGIDFDEDGVVDETNILGSFEGSVPADEGKYVVMYNGVSTADASVRLTWQRRGVGLMPLRRMRFEGNGTFFKCGNGTGGTQNLEICIGPAWNLVNNANESAVWGLSRSTFKNFSLAPVTTATNTNWGFMANYFGGVMENIWAHHFGRCFQQSSPGEAFNANTQLWIHIQASNCFGASFYSHGADNNGSLYVQVRTAGATGIIDDAYIGSTWLAPMSESNTATSNDPKARLSGTFSFRMAMGSNGAVFNPYLELGDPNPDIETTSRGQMVWVGSHAANRMPRGMASLIGGGVSEMVFAHSATDVKVRIPGTSGSGGAIEFEDRGSSYGGADGSAWYLKKDAGRWKFDFAGVSGHPSLELPTTPGSLLNNGGAVGPVWAQVSINHGSIAAGAFLEATATMANINVGDVVTCVEGSAVSDGTFNAYARVSAAGTVAIARGNPTAGAIDPASITYNCRSGVAQSNLFATASIDPPSIAADTTAEVTMTMTGLVANTPVWCSPAAAFTAGVTCMSNARASADGTASLLCANISGGAVDAAAVRVYCRAGAVQNAQANTQNLDYASIASNASASLTMPLSGIDDRNMTVCSPNAALPAGIIYSTRGTGGNASLTAFNIGTGAVDPASTSFTCYGWDY